MKRSEPKTSLALEIDPTVERFDRFIAGLLRLGARLSLALVLIGVAIMFIRHPADLTSREALPALLHPTDDSPFSLAAVASGLLRFEGRMIVMLGLLLLIATPVMRVLASIFLFARQRDPVYVVITALVLLLLVVSFFSGGVG